MIPRKEWSSEDWLAYIEGWSFERLGVPRPPPGAHGPEKREGVVRILDAMPERFRSGAVADAFAQLSQADRVGLFFDAGRAGAKGS